MKILISANNYPTPEYPLQAFIGVLAHELTKQEHEVTVVAPVSILSYLKQGIRLPEYHSIDIVKTANGEKKINIFRPKVIVPGEGHFKKVSSWITQKIVSKCIRNLNEGFDILYAHFWSSALNILDYVENVRTPLFVATGEDKIDTTYLRSPKNIESLLRYTLGTICVSTKNKWESIHLSLTTEDKCIVLPNAVNTKEFYMMDRRLARKTLGFAEDSFIIAFCGRFNERKGVMRVAEAIRCSQDSSMKSIFIGKPVEGSKLDPQCDGILFKGTLPHSEIVLYLNSADVYVLPSLAEGCSNSIVEAMACGLPIVSSDLPFNYDILDDSNSILIDPNDVNAIKEAILTLKGNCNLRQTMALNSLNKASNLTIEKRVSRIVDFIKSKINENN